MVLTDEIDRLVPGRVVLFGTPPPEGRDLDLVVRDEDVAALARALRKVGFSRRGRTFVRIRGCGGDAVELAPLSSWGLVETERDALFNDATPAAGSAKILMPSPAHTLLILARRVARVGGLDAKRRRRIAAALETEPDAWLEAAERAPAWGAARALEDLRLAFVEGRAPTKQDRIEAVAEELRVRQEQAPRLHSLRTIMRSRRKGAVISLSGLDGSGKTTQAEALQATLERLGYDSVVEWTKIARNPSLATLSRVAKRTLSRNQSGDVAPTPAPSPRRRSINREDSYVLTHGWATIVAITNAWSQRRVTSAHTRHGRIVICDRYVLDTATHLRYRYGSSRRFRIQSLLNRWISPQPVCSFLLEVPAEEALSRKAEQYDLGQLKLLESLYRDEAGRLGITRLDGQRPREELCEVIATAVWKRLSG